MYCTRWPRQGGRRGGAGVTWCAQCVTDTLGLGYFNLGMPSENEAIWNFYQDQNSRAGTQDSWGLSALSVSIERVGCGVKGGWGRVLGFSAVANMKLRNQQFCKNVPFLQVDKNSMNLTKNIIFHQGYWKVEYIAVYIRAFIQNHLCPW